MSKFFTAIAALALAMLATPVDAAEPEAASTENWVYAATGRDGSKSYVDINDVHRVGPYVTAWVYRAVPTGTKTPRGRIPYATELQRRVEDCTTRNYAVLAYEYRREDLSAIETVEAGWEDAKVNRRPRGDDGRVSEFICETAEQLPALTASLPAPKGSVEWTSVPSSPPDGFQYSIHAASMGRKDDFGFVVVRTVADTLGVDRDAGYYKSAVEAFLVACDDKSSAAINREFYDEKGTISAVFEQEVARVVEAGFTAPAEGSTMHRVADLACAAEQAAGTGTGWLSESGYIITASHVIEGANTIDIYQDGKRLGAASVVRDDPSNDVALLRPAFSTAAYPVLRLASTPARLGSRVVSMGYPLADDIGFANVRFTSGDVSSLSGVDVASGRTDDARLLQVSIPVQGGNSGGPVIDDQGAVVGIIISKKQSSGSEITQNLNFALKASYVDVLLREAPPLVSRKAAAPTAGVAASYQGGVFMILAGAEGETRVPASASVTASTAPPILLSTSQLSDSDWRVVYNQDGVVLAYRPTSLARPGGQNLRAIVRMSMPEVMSQAFQPGTRMAISEMRLDCAGSQFVSTQFNHYDLAGQYLGGHFGGTAPTKISPGGPMSALAATLCSSSG
jgi:S1-C subfamily serine protease